MKAFETRTVQKGRQLSSEDAVKARLKQIRDNKKSTYHKAFMDGDLAVMKSKNKTYRGKGLQYDIVELIPIPLGTDICGNCQKTYLSLDEDYLCPECRSEI